MPNVIDFAQVQADQAIKKGLPVWAVDDPKLQAEADVVDLCLVLHAFCMAEFDQLHQYDFLNRWQHQQPRWHEPIEEMHNEYVGSRGMVSEIFDHAVHKAVLHYGGLAITARLDTK